MDHITLTDYLFGENELHQKAKELMPWEPKSCTYNLGPKRQQIFACRTHNNIGLCYSCSIRCHTSCDLVELFTKRHFTCDCGTERDNRIQQDDQIRCEVRQNSNDDIPAMDNTYNQNYNGLFCDCHQEYDPDSTAIMLQCIMGLECNEDWYHDYCILGLPMDAVQRDQSTEDEYGQRLIVGFPPLDQFDAYICWKCVKRYEYYFERLISHELADKLFHCKITHRSGTKKDKADESEKNSSNDTKRARDSEDSNGTEYSIFLKADYGKVLKEIHDSFTNLSDKLYIFLDQIVSFLINDEPIYEPNEEDKVEYKEEDTDTTDLTTNLLQRSMKREDAVRGIVAFQSLQDRLNSFLKPFAKDGKVVKEDDIKKFFETPN